jgi:uncharacterized protein (TIGR03067 family)
MHRLVFLAASLPLLLPPLAAAADKPKGDLGQLQGTWTAKIGPEKQADAVFTFEGDDVRLELTGPQGRRVELKGKVKLGEAARPHKTIDWVRFTRPNGEDAPENLGLYEFTDADTLRVCNGGPGNERPTEFKAGDDGPPNLLVLKRKDKEKETKPGAPK